MRKFYLYFVSMLIFFFVFRFFGFIMAYAIRYWFIILPVILIIYFHRRRLRVQKDYRSQSGLDPHKEVKLKEEPEIIIEDEE
jgi:TctA family transporter